MSIFTLNRPASANAFNKALSQQLRAALAEFAADPGQYVAIITGAGEKAFCAGGDLKAMADDDNATRTLPVPHEIDGLGISQCEKPIIAAINGFAVGGGLDLALCCDVRLAADTAWFGSFEAARGMVGGLTAGLLPVIVGLGAAKNMMLSGERVSAQEAHRIGLIQSLLPQAELLDAAIAKAQVMAGASQVALWGTKKLLDYQAQVRRAELHPYFQAIAHRVLLTGDFLEGAKSFVEKREPRFSNRWPDPFAVSREVQ